MTLLAPGDPKNSVSTANRDDRRPGGRGIPRSARARLQHTAAWRRDSGGGSGSPTGD
jgi:hypothetical protein